MQIRMPGYPPCSAGRTSRSGGLVGLLPLCLHACQQHHNQLFLLILRKALLIRHALHATMSALCVQAGTLNCCRII